MSTVVVLTPVIIASWPAISAAVGAAIGALGFTVVGASALSVVNAEVGRTAPTSKNRVELELNESEVLAGTAGSEQSIIVERDGVQAKIARDARGSLKVCMEGHGYSKSQLKQIGEELIERITQQYVYHRIVTELKEKNMTIVNEEVDADQTVHIRVRNF